MKLKETSVGKHLFCAEMIGPERLAQLMLIAD